LRGPAAEQRDRRQHRRLLLQPHLRQAVRPAVQRVQSGAAGAHDRPYAADPLPERRGRHPLLPGLAQRGAHRRGQELLLRDAQRARLLPHAEQVHRLAHRRSGHRQCLLPVQPGAVDRDRDRGRGIACRDSSGDPPPGDRRRTGVATLASTSAPLSAQSLSALEAPPSGGASSARDFVHYLARKLAAAVVSFGMLLVVGFIIFSLMPSNPVEALTRGRPTSAKQMAFLIKQLGLNQPVWERFWHFVANTFQGHLGYSWQFETPVATLIAQRLWPTLLLMSCSPLISGALGMWLGIRSGWRPGSLLDRASTGSAITLWSVPTFWLGLILLVLFSSGSGPIPPLFPAGGMSTPGAAAGFT